MADQLTRPAYDSDGLPYCPSCVKTEGGIDALDPLKPTTQQISVAATNEDDYDWLADEIPVFGFECPDHPAKTFLDDIAMMEQREDDVSGMLCFEVTSERGIDFHCMTPMQPDVVLSDEARLVDDLVYGDQRVLDDLVVSITDTEHEQTCAVADCSKDAAAYVLVPEDHPVSDRAESEFRCAGHLPYHPVVSQ